MIERRQKPLTPPMIADHLGVKADKVLTWIRSGELRAFNVATKQGGRPLWRIKPGDLETFIVTRTNREAPPKPKGRKLPPVKAWY